MISVILAILKIIGIVLLCLLGLLLLIILADSLSGGRQRGRERNPCACWYFLAAASHTGKAGAGEPEGWYYRETLRNPDPEDGNALRIRRK